MPEARYFFHIQAPNQYYGDEGGTILPDDEAARVNARLIIEEVKSEVCFDCRGWVMIVQDDRRRTVFLTPFFSDE